MDKNADIKQNMSRNINQLCFCNKPLKQYKYEWKKCDCCCKEYDTNDRMQFYDCGPQVECKYYKITTTCYMVCAQCFNTTEFDEKSSCDNEEDFTFIKIESNMKIISKEMKKLTNLQQQRKYMYRIYSYLYKYCIAKLRNSRVEQLFNNFYVPELARIRDERDLFELELTKDIFINKNKNKNNKKSFEVNKISLEWFGLRKEEEISQIKQEKEKEMVEFEDIECLNIYQCSIRKRIEFIMEKFKKHFLIKYVYENNEEKDEKVAQYIDIFEYAFDDYDVIQLLNDYYHLKTFHLSDDGLMDCKILINKNKNNKKNETDLQFCSEYLFKKQREEELNQADIFNIYISY